MSGGSSAPVLTGGYDSPSGGRRGSNSNKGGESELPTTGPVVKKEITSGQVAGIVVGLAATLASTAASMFGAKGGSLIAVNMSRNEPGEGIVLVPRESGNPVYGTQTVPSHLFE